LKMAMFGKSLDDLLSCVRVKLTGRRLRARDRKGRYQRWNLRQLGRAAVELGREKVGEHLRG
jgi:hypothetical protein